MILLENVIGNFSTIELVWIASALAGLYAAFLNGFEASRDLNGVGHDLRNGLYRLAIGNVRRERIRGGVNAMYLALGVLAGFNPPNPDPTIVSVFGSLILVAAAVGMTINSFLERRDRLYLAHHGFTSRDTRALTQDEAEDLKFGLERRALEAEHVEAASDE